MEKIQGLTINESTYDLANGRKGKIAVFIYVGSADPAKILDYAIQEYVGNSGYYELVDAHLDNPWMRVVLSDINDMPQEQFAPQKHRLKS